ncbi:MAG: PEP/pyruvate-binding domain-containing protein [Pseudomonas sp.]
MNGLPLTQEIFHIGAGEAAPAAGADRLGVKAWNLARMASAGLRVPPAFVLTTDWYKAWRNASGALPALGDALVEHMRWLEQRTGSSFGGRRRPLLVSVRSGAPVSMPGMLETLLNIGLCDATTEGLLRTTGNPRLVWDSYRRLVRSYAEVVHAAAADSFDELTAQQLAAEGVASPSELDFHALRALTQESLKLFRAVTGQEFPQNPQDQLQGAVLAILRSWDSDKAVTFRRLNGIPEDLGTAVVVQAMVFGNSGGTSGSGVAFTRDPATGEKRLYVDFQFNSQGEDVVSGRHALGDLDLFECCMPALAAEVQEVGGVLEAEFGDMQEFEFTIEEGVLYLLQTRSGKRTPWAAVVVAVEQVREGLIGPAHALERLKGLDPEAVGRYHLALRPGETPLAHALSASPGVASGCIALSVAAAQALQRAGRPAILVRAEMATQDLAGIALANGVLSVRGGRTSHAAVVARQMDKVCLVGCNSLHVEAERGYLQFAGGEVLAEGELITLDGDSGEIWRGEYETLIERPEAWLADLRQWLDGPS